MLESYTEWRREDCVAAQTGDAVQASPSRRIKIGVVESDLLVREGLEVLLNSVESFDCIGAWNLPQEALISVRRHHPDVLLLDTRQIQIHGRALLNCLLLISPETRVILTMNCQDEWPDTLDGQPLAPRFNAKVLPTAVQLGVCGIAYKQQGFQCIAESIRKACAEGRADTSESVPVLLESQLSPLQPDADTSTIQAEGLTLRELQVFQLIGQGRSNKHIAREMDLCYSTVKNYVSSILKKFQLDGRTQIALAAQQMHREGRRPPPREEDRRGAGS